MCSRQGEQHRARSSLDMKLEEGLSRCGRRVECRASCAMVRCSDVMLLGFGNSWYDLSPLLQ